MPEITQKPELIDNEKQTLWTDFCEKAFKLGQLYMHIEQTEGQLRDLEKQRDVAMKNARGAADKHDKYIQSKANKIESKAQESVQ